METLENSDPTVKAISTYTEIINLVIWVFVILSISSLLETGLMDPMIKKEYQNIPLWKKIIPFENLKYSGINDTMHPKRFIENFEYLANQENLDEREKQYFFIQSLSKDAKNWLNLRGYGAYEEMKEAFLKFYWGPEAQNILRNFLENGRYCPSDGLSAKNYFFKYFNEATFLDNPPTEEEIIFYLLYHFDLKMSIRNELNSRQVKNVEEALNFLIRAEADSVLGRNFQRCLF
ncbi:uncharacterized protein LOC117179686 [Belonocnema kinseyi]|uniref:uncharacterized protein LOC117179686 n=1 Tax=Belonocnema kinseyi TaxID=2817044 RepID=UPI00143D04EA|nr:uncharacterized protein LOC117179686 [Belonocnema kinseyi]